MSGQALNNGVETTLGFYGKFPVRGDFVARNLPMDFIKPWDEWLQSAFAASREQMGDDWLQTYLTSPLWRFALSPGLCGKQRWAGVMMPSVDRVGRYFPLTIVAAIHNRIGLPELLCFGTGWFDQIENLALTALDNDFQLDTFEHSLARVQLPASMMPTETDLDSENTERTGAGRIAFHVEITDAGPVSSAFARLSAMVLEKYIPSYSLWNSEGSEQMEGSLLACEGLPPVDAFSSFLAGGWRKKQAWDIRSDRVRHYEDVTNPDFTQNTSSTVEELATEPSADPGAFSGDWHWSSYGLTDVGKKRKINEDALLDKPAQGLWIVADGMGGHQAGDLASQMITKSFEELEISDDLENAVSQIRAQLQQINRMLYLFATHGYGHQVVGSTVVAMAGKGGRCGFVWAGDSRLYRLRRAELVQLTRDHALIDEEGGSDLDTEGQSEPDGRERSNVITRAVGAEAGLELDSEMIEVEDGDTFLLCTDGLIKEVSIGEIREILSSGTPGNSAAQLMELALDRGARDNVTAVVVRANHS